MRLQKECEFFTFVIQFSASQVLKFVILLYNFIRVKVLK